MAPIARVGASQPEKADSRRLGVRPQARTYPVASEERAVGHSHTDHNSAVVPN